MADDIYKEVAKDLSKAPVELIAKIIEKHEAAILEQMHEEIRKSDLDIAKLKATVEKLTCWLVAELGRDAVETLMKELNN